MKTILSISLLAIATQFQLWAQKQSPLAKAIERDDYPTALVFVNNGQYISKANAKGETPLHQIAMKLFQAELYREHPHLFAPPKHPQKAWLTLAQQLVAKGAPLEAATESGLTPLMYALYFAPDSLSHLLLNAGAAFPADTNFLLPAILRGCHGLAKHYLEKGANTEMKNLNGEHLLHIAAKKGDLESVKLLLEYRADPNVQIQKDGGYFALSTPLHLAGMFGHFEMIRLLLQNGANPNANTAVGRLPLHYAACGARVEESLKPGKQPEEIFIGGGNAASVEALLSGTTNLHHRDTFGATPYYWAIYYRQLANADLLIEHGALPDAELGNTPDQLFSTGLSNLWFALRADSLQDRDAYIDKANHFFVLSDQAYQQKIKKIKRKKAKKILLNIAIGAAAGLAASYQANIMANAYGFGYSNVQYPVFSNQDLSTQKKYYKAQKRINEKLIDWSKTYAHQETGEAIRQVLQILDIKSEMNKE